MAKFISTAPKRPKKSKVIIALNIVIAVLIALVISTAVSLLGSGVDGYYNRKFGESYDYRYLERGDYTELLYQYYSDGGVIGRVNKGYEDLASVVEYADAAFRCSAYEKAGESEMAALQKERMEKAAEGVGIYGPELSKIDSLLSR